MHLIVTIVSFILKQETDAIMIDFRRELIERSHKWVIDARVLYANNEKVGICSEFIVFYSQVGCAEKSADWKTGKRFWLTLIVEMRLTYFIERNIFIQQTLAFAKSVPESAHGSNTFFLW